MVTLEATGQGLVWKRADDYKRKGKEMVTRFASMAIYVWLIYICFRFAVLLGNFLNYLIKLIIILE